VISIFSSDMQSEIVGSSADVAEIGSTYSGGFCDLFNLSVNNLLILCGLLW